MSRSELRPQYKCPLCGSEFDASDKTCHSCPMARSCNVVCCPNCGYGFARDSRLVAWLKRLFGKGKGSGRPGKPGSEEDKR